MLTAAQHNILAQLGSWSSQGVNLGAEGLQTIPRGQGAATYSGLQ